MIEELIQTQIKEYAAKRSIDIEFDLSIMDDDSMKDYDIVICAGIKPHILVSKFFVYSELSKSFADKRYVSKLKHYLATAVERLPKVHHHLGHLVSTDYAIALRNDTRRWVKTIFKDIIEYIPDKYLAVDYTVHVRDTITGSEVALRGDNIFQLETQAKARLIRMLISDEKTDELREIVKAAQLAKVEAIANEPVKIIISTDADDNLKQRMEY